MLLQLEEDTEARAAFAESLQLALQLEYQMLIAYLLGAAAELARRAGRLDRAAVLVGAAGALFAAIGMQVPEEETEEHGRTLGAVREALDAEEIERLLDLGRCAPLDELTAEAAALIAA